MRNLKRIEYTFQGVRIVTYPYIDHEGVILWGAEGYLAKFNLLLVHTIRHPHRKLAELKVREELDAIALSIMTFLKSSMTMEVEGGDTDDPEHAHTREER